MDSLQICCNADFLGSGWTYLRGAAGHAFCAIMEPAPTTTHATDRALSLHDDAPTDSPGDYT
ncbi:hypothetical protein, partial [Methylocella tundrae]|uniref:hypothetical protein n=1 Tax=Methylocella tundrae TaxID=227605 RepID=UPI001AED7F4E